MISLASRDSRYSTNSFAVFGAGGYAGQHMVYDNMGRVVQRSNPTEITGGWAPTGDDAAWARYL